MFPQNLDATKLKFYPGLCHHVAGSFVTIGASGTLRISRDLAAHWPAEKHYCQVGYYADGPALLIRPAETEAHILRWQTSREWPRRSPTISARGALVYFKIKYVARRAYPACWHDGMIQIDLSGTEGVTPPAEPDGPVETPAVTPAPDGPNPGRVVCAKCGVDYKAVKRDAGWCPWTHRNINGEICPGTWLPGLANSR